MTAFFFTDKQYQIDTIFAIAKIIILEIIFKYSPFWILLIFGAALGLTLLLYYKNRREDFSKGIIYSLSTLRFLAFFILGLYLISPMIKSKVKEVKKPIILLAIDNSQSIVSNTDSTYYNTEFQSNINKLKKQIEKKYRIDTYTFGEKLNKNAHIDFSEKSTDISQLFKEINRMYKHKNVGALILASDGIYNRGQNPTNAIDDINYPVYTLTLGDTTLRKDLAIDHIATNKIVFLGDRFPVEIKLTAKKAVGYSTEVLLFIDNKLVDKKHISINSDFQQKVIRFTPKAEKAGIRKLTVKVKTIDNEYNTANNSSTVFIEVIKARQKILVTYQSPHPDISAIIRSLKTSDNFEIEAKPFSEVTQIGSYNLVIYHNLPANQTDFVRMTNLMTKSTIPYIIIVGQQTNIRAFNQLKTGINIRVRKQVSNEVQPVLNTNFEMFTITKGFKDLSINLPPISSPFGKYTLSDNTTTALWQKVGNVTTNYPLVTATNTMGNMHAAIFGEGIWRWWLYDYQINGNKKAMDDFFGKLVKMVSLKINKEKFSIDFKNIYNVLENVEFQGMIYNDAYEPITQPDIKMKITDIDRKKEYDFTFSKGEKSYSLDAGRLEAGTYSFVASAFYDKKSYTKKGQFVVEDVNMEMLNLEANHRVLYQLSSETHGETFSVKEMNQIAKKLDERKDLVNVEYIYLKYNDLIDLKWLFFILIGLLSLEWFFRKYYGSY